MDGLIFDSNGLVVEPHVVDARLRRLVLYGGGGLGEFRWYEGQLGLDPYELEELVEWQITYVGRYGRQSADVVERWEATRLDRWVNRISEFLKAENPKVTKDTEQEWM